MNAARRVDPEWRLFEALVGRIEQDAAGAGIKVTSPDRLRCRVTARLREVDASIAYPDGSFATIECRKRRGRQDVTWIEQLATKRQSLGAARTIAVSSAGFSAAARQLAAEHGIELKELVPLAEVELNPLGTLGLVLFSHPKAAFVAARLRYARPGAWQTPTGDDIDYNLPAGADLNAPIFCNVDDGHCWSLNDVWHQVQSVANVFEGIGKTDPPVIRTACFPYPGNVSVQTSEGEKRLGDLFLSVALWIEVEPVWQADATKVVYSGEDVSRLQRVEFASAKSEQDWRAALQINQNAKDLDTLKTSGTWPNLTHSGLED